MRCVASVPIKTSHDSNYVVYVNQTNGCFSAKFIFKNEFPSDCFHALV